MLHLEKNEEDQSYAVKFYFCLLELSCFQVISHTSKVVCHYDDERNRSHMEYINLNGAFVTFRSRIVAILVVILQSEFL